MWIDVFFFYLGRGKGGGERKIVFLANTDEFRTDVRNAALYVVVIDNKKPFFPTKSITKWKRK